jgi:hypothetical protein
MGHSVDRTDHSVDRMRYSVDRMGHPVDRTSHPVDRTDHSVDRMGHPVDRMGHPVDRTGHPVDRTDHSVDRMGHSVDRTDHSVDRMRYSVDRMGHPVDRAGHSVDRIWCFYQVQGGYYTIYIILEPKYAIPRGGSSAFTSIPFRCGYNPAKNNILQKIQLSGKILSVVYKSKFVQTELYYLIYMEYEWRESFYHYSW